MLSKMRHKRSMQGKRNERLKDKDCKYTQTKKQDWVTHNRSLGRCNVQMENRLSFVQRGFKERQGISSLVMVLN